jgi:hypothetical protein
MTSKTSKIPQTTTSISSRYSSDQNSNNSTNISQSMKKILILTQVYTFLILTCGTRTMQKQSNQPTSNPKKDLLAKKHFG